MKKGEQEFDLSQVIRGSLNIFGLKIDLAKLLDSPEDVKDQLEELRDRLKQAGGKEVLTDEEWKRGGASISGQIRTRGILGEREYHLGTSSPPRPRARPSREPQPPPEVVEPSVDVFDEPDRVTIVADVPGVGHDDLEIEVNGRQLSISTRRASPRTYQKTVELDPEADPTGLQFTCRNGVLAIILPKRKPQTQQPSPDSD